MAAYSHHFSEWDTAVMIAAMGFGAVAMRGAGCTINDLWDRNMDNKVSIYTHTHKWINARHTQNSHLFRWKEPRFDLWQQALSLSHKLLRSRVLKCFVRWVHS